jgi:hypothetical protein
MKLYTSLALLLLAGNADADIYGTNTEDACDDESGYEVWRSLPPEDAKVRFEGRVDCDAETYTLIYSFEPDMVRDLFQTVEKSYSLTPRFFVSICTNSPRQNLPFINNVTKVDWTGATANPDKAAICAAEGLGPGLSEHVPEGTHVGQNVHYTDYSYSYETTKRIQDATGFKLLTIGTEVDGTFSNQTAPRALVFLTPCLSRMFRVTRCRSLRYTNPTLSPLQHSFLHRRRQRSQENAVQIQWRLLLQACE